MGLGSLILHRSSALNEALPNLVLGENLCYGSIDLLTPSTRFSKQTHLDDGSTGTRGSNGLDRGATFTAETTGRVVAAIGGGVFVRFGFASDFDVFLGEDGDQGVGCIADIRCKR